MYNDKYLGKLMPGFGKCWGMNKWAMGWGRAFKEGLYEKVTMECRLQDKKEFWMKTGQALSNSLPPFSASQFCGLPEPGETRFIDPRTHVHSAAAKVRKSQEGFWLDHPHLSWPLNSRTLLSQGISTLRCIISARYTLCLCSTFCQVHYGLKKYF